MHKDKQPNKAPRLPGAHGYQLERSPIIPARVKAALSPGRLGLPIKYYDQIDSTNLEGCRLAQSGAGHGTCLVADYQSAGRGRLDRQWQAPPGASLLFSIILRPTLKLDLVFGLTNLMALAVCKAVESLSDLTPGIKWPNDVYLNGRKLVGILTEFTPKGKELDFAVVGAGLNVNLTRTDLDKLPAPAASLLAATGRIWDRGELLVHILKELDRLYDHFMEPEHDVLVKEYEKRSITLGQHISVRDGQIVRTGRAQKVANDGTLMMLEENGKLVQIRHGDVSVLKS